MFKRKGIHPRTGSGHGIVGLQNAWRALEPEEGWGRRSCPAGWTAPCCPVHPSCVPRGWRKELRTPFHLYSSMCIAPLPQVPAIHLAVLCALRDRGTGSCSSPPPHLSARRDNFNIGRAACTASGSFHPMSHRSRPEPRGHRKATWGASIVL